MTGESSTDMYTQSGVKWRAGDELPCGTGPGPLMTPRGRMWGGEGAPQRGAVWIITAHSRRCTAQARTTLQKGTKANKGSAKDSQVCERATFHSDLTLLPDLLLAALKCSYSI